MCIFDIDIDEGMYVIHFIIAYQQIKFPQILKLLSLTPSKTIYSTLTLIDCYWEII